MDKLSRVLTDYYLNKNYISSDKKEVYEYGFKLIIADLINFSLVLILGGIVRRFSDSVVFLITLCTVRQFSGGFHAKTFWICRLSMVITFISVIICTNLFLRFGVSVRGVLFINILCDIFIGVFSPVKHKNKKLTEEQKYKNKMSAVIISLIFSVISVIFTAAKNNWGITILSTLIAVVILMIVGILVQKGGSDDV